MDQRQAMHERAKHDHLQQERMAKSQEKSTAGRDRDRVPKRKQVANSATSGNWEARSCDSFVETGPLPSAPGLDVSMITVGTFGYEKKPACCKALNLELAGGLQEILGRYARLCPSRLFGQRPPQPTASLRRPMILRAWPRSRMHFAWLSSCWK